MLVGDYMYVREQLPASLSGVVDMFNVKRYWEAIKGKIKELQELGFHISTYQQRLGVAYTNLMSRGKTKEAELLKEENRKVQNDLDKWWKVKGYLDKYLPEWMKIDSASSVGPSGVGAIPLVLAGASVAALAYVVHTGMALLQDYSFKKHLTSQVIEGKMTSGQAAEILSVAQVDTGGIVSAIKNVGTGLGVGIPVALVGIGIFMYMNRAR